MTATSTGFRTEDAVFRSTAGMPGRFASNFDFQLALILGAADAGGSAIGECYATVATVADGDLRGWTRAWQATATRIEETATRCATEGHRVSASDAYLRASGYWRTAGFFLDRTEHDRRIELWTRAREAFRAGIRLAGIPCETLAIPFENGKTLPGYFLTAPGPAGARKTLIVLPGGDSTAEEHYFMIGAAARRRGYQVLLVEIPGQRGAYYSDPELTFRPDVDVQFRSIVDHALARPEVDPDRLALAGYSMGGNFGPRAVAGEKRIKALVASTLTPTMVPDIASLLGLDPDDSYADRTDLDALVDTRSPMAHLLLGDVRERFGMLDRPVRDYLDYLAEFDLWDLADRITCPVLSIGGEGEGTMTARSQRFYDMLTCPKRRHLLTETQGAEAHCAINNRALANQIELDFLDEVLDGEPR